jgi:hypothetical protein
VLSTIIRTDSLFSQVHCTISNLSIARSYLECICKRLCLRPMTGRLSLSKFKNPVLLANVCHQMQTQLQLTYFLPRFPALLLEPRTGTKTPVPPTQLAAAHPYHLSWAGRSDSCCGDPVIRSPVPPPPSPPDPIPLGHLISAKNFQRGEYSVPQLVRPRKSDT